MDRRTFVGACASGLLASLAGCSGGREDDTTTTTTDVPQPTATTGERTPTTRQTTQPTTAKGSADFRVRLESVDPADREVLDGVATVVAVVENVGDAAGEHTATVRLQHRQLAERAYTQTVTVALDAGDTERVRLRADFRTTGVYDLYLDGERVGAIDVERLSPYSGGGGRVQSKDPDPTISVVARANVTAR